MYVVYKKQGKKAYIVKQCSSEESANQFIKDYVKRNKVDAEAYIIKKE